MWDLFCSVVDNYGDIGVSWRLSRVLQSEHGVAVRLWVDDLPAFARIEPRIDPAAATQRVAGVEVRAWREPFPDLEPGAAVIEAFGCRVPEGFVVAMARRVPAPVWVNLEYLTAEPWAAGCHGLPSPHPRLPLLKHFFFPGFDPDMGGVLRERGLLEARDMLQAEPRGDALRVSVFAYRDAPLLPLLETWSRGAERIDCTIPDGAAVEGVRAFLGRGIAPGESQQRGALTVRVIPFTDQGGYDQLLWRCDWNFVRGEDSFVRAQWAARPLVWQLYPQEAEAHFAKLEAFLDRYAATLEPAARTAVAGLIRAWNGVAGAPAIGAAWANALRCRAELDAHARFWSARLAAGPELGATLAGFVRARVK